MILVIETRVYGDKLLNLKLATQSNFYIVKILLWKTPQNEITGIYINKNNSLTKDESEIPSGFNRQYQAGQQIKAYVRFLISAPHGTCHM